MQEFKLTEEQFRIIQNRVSIVAADYEEEILTILQGVHLQLDLKQDGELGIWAGCSDGSRAVIFDTGNIAKSDHVKTGAFIIPASAFRAAEKLGKRKTAGDVELCVHEGAFTFRFKSNEVVSGRLIPGDYPLLGDVFPHEPKHWIQGRAADFLPHCKLINLIDDRLPIILKFTGTDSAKTICNVSMGDHECLTYSYQFEVESSLGAGEILVTPFNPLFLQDAIDTGAELFKMETSGYLKPAIFTDSDPRVRHLLMPLQSKAADRLQPQEAMTARPLRRKTTMR